MIDYRCDSCETTQELLVERDSTDPINCSSCTDKPMRRLAGACRQFEFKGDGTYDKGKTSHGKLT